ncbi:MAG TPA: carboxylating nicotinate-nucleotide diphosphorylase [Saprospiraceae bacterium]|nr:carboxylating nicotinate-nucleotide diphosphorylase [Saprospiraceae bacterium]
MFEVSEAYLKWFIEYGLKEDVGSGDHTSNACIDPKSRSKAALIVKDHGLIAGVELAKMIFLEVDPKMSFETYFTDGKPVIYGDIAFEVTCNTRSLLMVERLILNTMQRMSGIASMSSRFAFEVNDLPVKILDTRKTTPLLRPLEKWAVKIGGCQNYRTGLYDWIMIKDNHIDAAGGISEAIVSVHQYLKDQKLNLGITIEVRNLVELQEVLEVGGVTRIMLDNFEIPLLKEAVETVDGRFETEASGGIHLQNVRKIAMTGVDYISTGAVTHSAGILDLSLKII